MDTPQESPPRKHSYDLGNLHKDYSDTMSDSTIKSEHSISKPTYQEHKIREASLKLQREKIIDEPSTTVTPKFTIQNEGQTFSEQIKKDEDTSQQACIDDQLLQIQEVSPNQSPNHKLNLQHQESSEFSFDEFSEQNAYTDDTLRRESEKQQSSVVKKLKRRSSQQLSPMTPQAYSSHVKMSPFLKSKTEQDKSVESQFDSKSEPAQYYLFSDYVQDVPFGHQASNLTIGSDQNILDLPLNIHQRSRSSSKINSQVKEGQLSGLYE